MVRQGDFEVTLVHAETKEPFPEHLKDGQVYVEVEPEQEYFIGIQRVGNDVDGPMLARLFVDDKRLEHYHFFNSSRNTSHATTNIGPPTYHGLWALKPNKGNNDDDDDDDSSNNHDTWTDTALKFTKPRLIIQQQEQGKQQQQGQRRSRLLMGQIKVEFYKAILVEKKDESKQQASSSASSSLILPTKSPPPSKRRWKASAIRTTSPSGPNSLVEKKSLRSGPGSTCVIQQKRSRIYKQQQPQQRSYKRGIQVYVFTLHYCAATGLMQVGVLSKPPVWVYHKMLLSSPQTRRAATTTGLAASNDVDDDDVASPISNDTTTTVDSSTGTTTSTTTATPTEQIVRTHELIDLVDDDRDDDSDDHDSHANDHANEKSPTVEMNV